MGKISEENKWKIVNMIGNGESQRKVARDLKIGQTTVRWIWKKYLETGSIENKMRSGRPQKLNVMQERILCRNSRRYPFNTAREVYNDSMGLPSISVCTARRYLRRNNLFGRIAVKKPLLNKKQIKNRLLWCKAYAALTPNDWKKCVFTDESRFEIHSTRRRYVRRQIGHRFKNAYICKTVKFGGYSVMVWGAVKGDGLRMLKLCPVRLDSSSYQTILEDGLLPFLENDEIFIQDGAPCHRSKSTIDFLENNGVCYMADWPAQSPDLNIIENLWSIVKKNVSKHTPMSKFNLWEIVQSEWYKIENKIIIDLFDSIPRRIKAVLKNKGLNTKY